MSVALSLSVGIGLGPGYMTWVYQPSRSTASRLVLERCINALNAVVVIPNAIIQCSNAVRHPPAVSVNSLGQITGETSRLLFLRHDAQGLLKASPNVSSPF